MKLILSHLLLATLISGCSSLAASPIGVINGGNCSWVQAANGANLFQCGVSTVVPLIIVPPVQTQITSIKE